MPHKRKPSTYQKKLLKKQQKTSLKQQKRYSKQIVQENTYYDKQRKETINLLPRNEIIRRVTKIYPDAPPQAIPNIQDGQVLDVTNQYHLNIFQTNNT